MGEKKPSMRDIARACGCSLATVSYALNHTGPGKIGKETRLRVIETAKRLNYIPNRASRVRPGRAAILTARVPGDSVGRRAALMDLARELMEQLNQEGIPAVVLEYGDLVEEWKRVTALSPAILFLLDSNSGPVAYVNPPCVQPIIFVDSDNDDPLYYKVLPDYPFLLHSARRQLGADRLFLMTESVRSAGLLSLMTRGVPAGDLFVNDGRDMAPFLAAHQGWRGVVVGDLLAVEVCRQFPPEQLAVISALDRPALFPPELTVIPVPNRARAATAVEVALDLLALSFDPEKGNRVLLGPERRKV